MEKCKYCNIKDPNDNFKTIASLEVGKVEIYTIGFWIGHDAGFDISSDFDKKSSKSIPMKYCPFCGREIGENLTAQI